jgi:signal transduction histidine kinase
MSLTSSPLGAARAGDHLCYLYEGEDEKRRTLVSFIREALARQERCLYVADPRDHADLVVALEGAGVAARRAVERGALVFATTTDVYLRTGRFDADDALAALDGFVDGALADGFAGLCATGESARPVPDELWPAVLAYEARLNEHFAPRPFEGPSAGPSARPFVGLCRFDAAAVSPERLGDVLRTHPRALVRGEVCDNPFYERPALALSDDGRARLDWRLHQLRAHHRARRHVEAMATTAAAAAAQLCAEGDRRQLETDRLGRSLRARDRFLAVLADELAAPLHALKRELHALASDPDEASNAARLEAATRQLRRLSASIERARDVGRLLDGETSSVTDACDLVGLVREVGERHREDLAAAACALAIDAPLRVAGVWDRVALQRLVATLLLNAATRGAGRPVEIEVRADPTYAFLTFRDAGPGADAELANRATGLGLTLARDLVAAVGGRLVPPGARPGATSARVRDAGTREACAATLTVELPRTRARPRG